MASEGPSCGEILKEGSCPYWLISSAWSFQFLGSLCALHCRNCPNITLLILKHCIQKFCKSLDLLDMLVRTGPSFQLPQPHWQAHRADSQDFQHNDLSSASSALGSNAPKGSDPRDAVPRLRTGCLWGWPAGLAAQRGFQLARSTGQGPASSQAMPENGSELGDVQGYHSNDKSMSAFPLRGITLGRPLIFIFYIIRNDRRTKSCFTNSIWIRQQNEECYPLVLVVVLFYLFICILFIFYEIWGYFQSPSFRCSPCMVMPEHKAVILKVIQGTYRVDLSIL